MQKLLVLLLLIGFWVPAFGAADVWACQGVKSGGIYWENGRWEADSFITNNYLVKVYGASAQLSQGGIENMFSCSVEDAFSQSDFLNCHNPYGTTFLLNLATGAAGISELLGSTSERESKDTVTVEALQCTKF